MYVPTFTNFRYHFLSRNFNKLDIKSTHSNKNMQCHNPNYDFSILLQCAKLLDVQQLLILRVCRKTKLQIFLNTQLIEFLLLAKNFLAKI